MYSTHNEGNPNVTEIFIKTLKQKSYKFMTLILRTVYINKLSEMLNE